MALLVLASLALASTTTPALQARAEAPAAAGAPVLGGPAIAGVCLLSRPAVFSDAKVGEVATTRLRQLVQQADAEIAADRQPIEAARKAFQADKAKLSPAQQQQREQAIVQQVRALEQKAQLRSKEIELTREKAQTRIATEMLPLLQQVYAARGCGLLLDRASVIGGNLANDLTPAVVKELDAKIYTISFDRETIATAAQVGPQSPLKR